MNLNFLSGFFYGLTFQKVFGSKYSIGETMKKYELYKFSPIKYFELIIFEKNIT